MKYKLNQTIKQSSSLLLLEPNNIVINAVYSGAVIPITAKHLDQWPPLTKRKADNDLFFFPYSKYIRK